MTFQKSRTPRVFQTYMNSYKDVSTLAHELGHAYHSWALKDLPRSTTEYTMSLAETASIFSETLLADHLIKISSPDIQFEIAWAEANHAAGLLINIPARYEFEKNFYTARQNGPLSPEELNQMTDQAWRKWYGENLSETEKQYWMTKLHFSISGVSFYNFPYTFGYLFSLGIYAQKEKYGKDFFKLYTDILKDTGRMTAEDLIKKHLNQDITQPEFWLESLKIVEKKAEHFENLLKKQHG